VNNRWCKNKIGFNNMVETRDSLVPLTGELNMSIGLFCSDKKRVVKITRSSSEMVLQTTKHTMIYTGSGPSLEVTALHSVVWY
jgi:hypothetical protein